MKRILTSTLFSLSLFALFGVNTFAQSPSREELLRQVETKHEQLLKDLQKIEKQLLLPSEEDQLTYAEFLTQPDTGLIRLLPREIYDSYAHPEKRLGLRGGGSYYSFTERNQEYGNGTQIGLEQGSLLVCFAGANYGMVANLGDVPLEEVALGNSAVKFLVSYERADNEPLARVEYRRFGSGVTVNGTLYKTRLPAIVNNSYVMRGISYSNSDIVVAFRVVRKDSDGSMIVAWKLLKKYPTPELARTTEPAN
ncbi:MAG TPA: hypothetical protein VN956_06880 [Pyrinomonadaceae bacterium]|nr:hypothetical protein [Pyrinomonadaceae bacterium]